MAVTNRVTWETLRTFDTSTVSDTTYHNVGTPLKFPSYKLKLVNNSNILLLVSINGGVSNIDVVPPNSYWLYDEMQAPFSTASQPAVPQGTQISVSAPGGAAGVGLVYLVSQYVVQA